MDAGIRRVGGVSGGLPVGVALRHPRSGAMGSTSLGQLSDDQSPVRAMVQRLRRSTIPPVRSQIQNTFLDAPVAGGKPAFDRGFSRGRNRMQGTGR